MNLRGEGHGGRQLLKNSYAKPRDTDLEREVTSAILSTIVINSKIE